MPHRFSGTEKDQSSSDESWETLPGKDENEPELQSDSSGPEEENQELSLQEGYVLFNSEVYLYVLYKNGIRHFQMLDMLLIPYTSPM